MNVERGMTSSFVSHEPETISHTSIQAAQEQPSRYIGLPILLIVLVQLLVMGGFVTLAYTSSESNCTNAVEVPGMLGVAAFELLMYVQACLWVLFCIIDLVNTSLHSQLKMKGYLRFYRSFKLLQRYTLYAFTFFTAAMLAYSAYSHCNERTLWGWNRVCVARILISAEAGLIAALSVAYIVKVVNVNRSHSTPDTLEDTTVISFRQHSLDSNEAIGFKAEDFVDDILERQADTIRCLREQNAVLSKKLYHRQHTAMA